MRLLAFVVLATILSLALPSSADENQPLSLDYPRRVWNDFLELPTLPASFTKAQWAMAGGLAAATALALSFDGEFRTIVRQSRNEISDRISQKTTHFGDYHDQAPIQLGAWFLGSALNYTPLKKSAADSMEASLFAAGMVTPLLTRLSGRALPVYNQRPMLFQPFESGPGHESFPSGHTTEAFAVATVFDIDFRETLGYWHTPLLYGLALSTGMSRVYDQKHYLSDVILGAGIGTSIGAWIARKPRNGAQVFPLLRADGPRVRGGVDVLRGDYLNFVETFSVI